MLKDYLAKLPAPALRKTRITQVEVILPVRVNPIEFHKLMNTEINKEELTTEKAIYLVARETIPKFKDSIELLNSKLRF